LNKKYAMRLAFLFVPPEAGGGGENKGESGGGGSNPREDASQAALVALERLFLVYIYE